MKYFIIVYFGILFCLAVGMSFSMSLPAFTVANGQVYLDWDSRYGCTYTILRGTVKDGTKYIIKEKLEEPKWVDTPEETERTYYYAIESVDKDDGEIRDISKEVGVYVP